MPEFDSYQLWSEFPTAWSASRIRQMRLEEYTNSSSEDAFIGLRLINLHRSLYLPSERDQLADKLAQTIQTAFQEIHLCAENRKVEVIT